MRDSYLYPKNGGIKPGDGDALSMWDDLCVACGHPQNWHRHGDESCSARGCRCLLFNGPLMEQKQIDYLPKPVKAIWIVVRLSEEKAPSYAPKSSEVRTKKFWSEAEARKLCVQFDRVGTPHKLYRADVSEWLEA